MAKKKTLYDKALNIISSLKVGEKTDIALPKNIKAFRKYLYEISARHGKKFATKVIDERLHIMRVEYTNIYF